jgi:hypothetical protein
MHLTLAVYDVLGRPVAVPAEGMYPVGSHAVNWTDAGVAPGLYFVRLEGANFALVRPVVKRR